MNMETAVTVLVFTCLVVTGCSAIHLFNLKAHVKWTENIFLFKLYFKIYLKLKLFFLKDAIKIPKYYCLCNCISKPIKKCI